MSNFHMIDRMNGSQPASSGSETGINALYGLAYVIVLYIGLTVSNMIYNSITRMWKDRVQLFPNTYTSGTRMYTALQDPSLSTALTIYPSENRRNGIEFSYSMFIYIKASTFNRITSGSGLYHIMHKGYPKTYPLFGPGIFCREDENTLRIYMNSFNTWNNYKEIQNIPVDKWFHLTITCKGNIVYIYINGNLKQKMSFSSNNNSSPYQNYGNVYLFNNRKLSINNSPTASICSDSVCRSDEMSPLVFSGSIDGMVSRVYYFSYALTYTEIQSLMNVGPSTVMDSQDMSISPYLINTWWTNPITTYNSSGAEITQVYQ
jgi:hypothetical protein